MDNIQEQEFILLLDDLLTLLKKYEKQTDQMISADLEIIQDVLISRNDTIEEMKTLREKMKIIVDSEPEGSKLKQILTGATVTDENLTVFEKQAMAKMRVLQMIQQSVLGKDFKITHRVKENYENIRKELEALKQDKKKINYYSSASGNIKGSSLDSSM